MTKLILISIGMICIYLANFIKNNDYKKDLFYYLNIFNMIIYLGLSIVTYLQFYKEINFINLISLILSLLTLIFTLIFFYKSNVEKEHD